VAQEALELEGTWEEIMAHAAALAGRRVRLVVLPGQPDTPPESQKQRLSPTNQRMLELLTEWEQTSLTTEEHAVLEGLEQHLKEHPFSLRDIEDNS
jgi:hypothetical protein